MLRPRHGLLAAFIWAALVLPCSAQEPDALPAPSAPPSNPTAAPVTHPLPAAAPASQPDQAAKSSAPAASQAWLRGYLDPSVPKPKDMFYRGPGAGVGSLFGAVGAAATAGADNGPKGQLLALMGKEHIDISDILLSETQSKLGTSPELEKQIHALGDVRLHLEILMYGLVKTQLFSSTMYPTIKVRMTLAKEASAPVWTESEWVATAASENDKGFSFDTFMKEPDKIRLVLTNVSRIATNRLLLSLQKKLAR